MSTQGRPLGYTGAQIALHWIIATLVTFQVLFGEGIGPAYRALRRGTEASADDLFSANLHVYVGISILVLATFRLVLRILQGTTPLSEGERPVLKWIAASVHTLFYVVIFGMPVSGLLAWYLGLGGGG